MADAATVINPRTGETLYTVAETPETEIAAVYERAWAAAAKLRAMTIRERIEEAVKLKKYLIEYKEKVVDHIVAECGKSRMDAMIAEVFTTLDVIEYYEHNAEKILADQKAPTPLILWPKKSHIYFEPLGPVLLIAPWNYPFNLSFVPFVCAFIAGNPVILKPSSYTPLKGMYEHMLETSGFIKDGLQVVYGTRKTGEKLIDARPKKILFTGSVGAGRKVMEQAARHLIPVDLELGGKDPMLVFDDVNIERTVNGALWGSLVNCGQTCTSVERIYVQEGIYDKFVAMTADKIKKLRTLPQKPDEMDLDVGCMTTEFQVKTVEEHIAQAVAKGAKILAGGKREPGSHAFPPTLIVDVDHTMDIVKEETFGPIVAIMKFRTEDEAIALANDSPYGLSSSVWTADLQRAARVARRIETGSVSVNNALATLGNAGLPFGGVKDSGIGRYKSAFGLYSFSNIKAVMFDTQSNKIELNWYPYSRKKYKLMGELLDVAFNSGLASLLRTAWVGIRLELLSRKHRL